jgi:hypothetical protein
MKHYRSPNEAFGERGTAHLNIILQIKTHSLTAVKLLVVVPQHNLNMCSYRLTNASFGER